MWPGFRFSLDVLKMEINKPVGPETEAGAVCDSVPEGGVAPVPPVAPGETPGAGVAPTGGVIELPAPDAGLDTSGVLPSVPPGGGLDPGTSGVVTPGKGLDNTGSLARGGVAAGVAAGVLSMACAPKGALREFTGAGAGAGAGADPEIKMAQISPFPASVL